MGFSISHKNGFEKEPENGRHGHREENTINKNENEKKNDSHKTDVGGKDKNEEKKLPPINTDLSIKSIIEGNVGLSASDADKKRKCKEAEQKRKAWIEKNRVVIHL